MKCRDEIKIDTIRSMNTREASGCERLLRSLPDWFGIESAIVRYRQDIEQQDTYVAVGGKTIFGFITLKYHNAFSAEILVMAVEKANHRCGIGSSLMNVAEYKAKESNIQFLQVKTLGASHPDIHYKSTRAFYFNQGFRPLEENQLWGKTHPCLIMVKAL
ncbi:MAG: GNAT family N-acetyltransferase [Desulfobacterales bacterium]|nr:GNAT family N-acetyltransferase [Desulfobacterales bacterium]